MEFVAMTKTGVKIYDAFSFKKKAEGFGDDDAEPAGKDTSEEPMVSLPAATNAEGFVSTNAEGSAWSPDGSFLATVNKGVPVIWDATAGYKLLMELPVAGNSGGARALRFSPGGSYLSTYEKHDKEKCPENMQVFDISGAPSFERVRLQTLKGYSSGAVPSELIQWSTDESVCLELIPGEGLVLLDRSLKAVEPRQVVPEPYASSFQLSPRQHGGACYVSCYVPEAAGRTAEVSIYHLSDFETSTSRQQLPNKLKGVTMHWNSEGSVLLALASSDVDETGASYFGTTCLYWLRADGKGKLQVTGPEDGLVQDVAWSPTANEFLLILGMMPATTSLYDGKTGKHLSTLGKSRRNTIRWSPFGRLLVVGGFGALPGDMEFFDRSSEETVCSFRASLTVNCCWAPDGRHFLTSTTAPRMNEDNQVSVFRYTGERLLRVDYKPPPGEGSRRDPLARADAGAMLFAASWRPCKSGTYEDRPITPPKGGQKRTKGLPSEGAGISAAAAPKVAAYRPGGGRGGGGSVAAMMRGEAPISDWSSQSASDDRGRGERWGETVAGGMTHEEMKAKLKEQKEAEKQKKLAEEEAARAAKEAERAAYKQLEENDKKLKRLKKELAMLQELKEKPWDELTEEDEKQLEGEMDLRTQIEQLEKGKS